MLFLSRGFSSVAFTLCMTACVIVFVFLLLFGCLFSTLSYFCNSEVDIVAITDAVKIAATPIGFRYFDHPRPDRTGGGTGVLVCDSLVAKQGRAGILNSFEYSEWIITSGSVRLRQVAIHSLPYSPNAAGNHPVTASMFLTELGKCLESIVMPTEPVIMAGDFIIQVNVTTILFDFSTYFRQWSSIQQHIGFRLMCLVILWIY